MIKIGMLPLGKLVRLKKYKHQHGILLVDQNVRQEQKDKKESKSRFDIVDQSMNRSYPKVPSDSFEYLDERSKRILKKSVNKAFLKAKRSKVKECNNLYPCQKVHREYLADTWNSRKRPKKGVLKMTEQKDKNLCSDGSRTKEVNFFGREKTGEDQTSGHRDYIDRCRIT